MTLGTQVQLSFGASNGAWDDRELIHACDAAMDEFHAHHPGPGSWLDKITAAQMDGKPLPSATMASSVWYEVPAATAPTPGPSRIPSPSIDFSSRKRRRHSLQNDVKTSSKAMVLSDNPYTANADAPIHDATESPRYVPQSPSSSSSDANHTHESDAHKSHAASTVTGPAPAIAPAGHAPIPPVIGARLPENISAQDAMSYAMASQYWAGYWMGISQTLSARQTTSAPRESAGRAHSARPEPNGRVDDATAVTRRQGAGRPLGSHAIRR